MVMMPSALCRRLTLRVLKILLNGRKILLGGGHISGLQVLRKLIEMPERLDYCWRFRCCRSKCWQSRRRAKRASSA